MRIDIPNNVQQVMDTIENNGFEAYVVGGCVRDSILGRIPHDWDITTDAKPEDIQHIFDNVIPTGIKHGTVTVMFNGEGYEVTTFRSEGKYSDSRHPDSVQFVSTIEEDLSRRDFTMNAIAYNNSMGIVDPFNGIADIEKKTVMCVGSADDRFKEDPLRMLRAVRFSAQLGFKISRYIEMSIHEHSRNICCISKERVKSEMDKILISDPSYIAEVECFNLLFHTMYELCKLSTVLQNNEYHKDYNAFWHSVKTAEIIENDLTLRWTAILHDLGKIDTKFTDVNGVDHFPNHHIRSVKLAEEVMRRMKFDNKTIKEILTLIKYHSIRLDATDVAVKGFLNEIGSYDLFKKWVSLRWADILAQNPKYSRVRLEKLMKISTIGERIIYNKEPYAIEHLAINGNDVVEIGYIGKEVGVELNRLLGVVIGNKFANNREYLIEDSVRHFNSER